MALNWKLCSIYLVVFIGLAVLLVTSLVFALTGGKIPFDYGVIIDAGSSHSEAILYQWKGDKNEGTGEIVQIYNCENDRGISTFEDPMEAGESLLPCLRNVAEKVEEEKRSEVPVHLAATAGMRLLSKSNYYKSLATFTALKCAIPKSSMSVGDVGIITGQDEGLYAWISTNYILGTLQKKEPTRGAADMGGASTQISFEVKGAKPNHANVATLKLFGKEYQVYSVSYLCYGSLEIFRRYLASLVEDHLDVTTVVNPCGNEGHILKETAAWLFDQPCTKTEKLRKYVFLNPDKMNMTYTFKGKPDTAECRKHVEKLFDPTECSKKYEECFSPIDKSIRPEGFMAFSSYYYTVEFMKAENQPLSQYKKNVETFCQREWQKVIDEKHSEGTIPVLPRFCFQGIAVDVILTKGYHFDEDTWKNIQFARKVDGKSVGWALGYMTNATNAIPEEDPTDPAIGVPVLVILLIIGVAFLLLGGFIYFRKKNISFKTSELP